MAILVNYRKWPDLPHYRFFANHLGEDEHGVWLGMAPGTRYAGPRNGAFATATAFLIPRTAWWTALWHPSPDEVDLYVDICAPCRWSDGQVTTIDLDLDVVRFRDGRVMLDDEDEFQSHRAALGYPPEMVEGALAAANEVIAAVRQRREPFGQASVPWLTQVMDSTSPRAVEPAPHAGSDGALFDDEPGDPGPADHPRRLTVRSRSVPSGRPGI